MALSYFIVKRSGYEAFFAITLGDKPLLEAIKLRENEELIYKGVYDGGVAISLYQRIIDIVEKSIAGANKNGRFDAATLESHIIKITQK